MGAGIEADIAALRDFVRTLPPPEMLEDQLLSAFKVTPPDFTGGQVKFTDGELLKLEYRDKVDQFDAASRKLIARLRALQQTVGWIADQYEQAKREDQVGASDVDRQFNAGLTAALTPPAG